MNTQLKSMLFKEFNDDPQLNELNDILTTQKDQTKLTLVKPYMIRIQEKKATLSDVASWLYLLCTLENPIIKTMEFLRFIIKFNFEIQLPNQPEFDDIYTRVTSTIPYTFDLTKNDDVYMLRIHSPVVTTSLLSAEETKSSGGNLKKNKRTKHKIKSKHKTKRTTIKLFR